MDEAILADGAISKKNRELVAIAVALTTQCGYCLEVHRKAALAAGASEAEIAEVVFVAVVDRPGVLVSSLYEDDRETVRMEVWESGNEVTIDTTGGAEILVLEGGCEESGEQLEQHTWIRVPVGGDFCATAGSTGARVWVKTGHLRSVEAPSI